MANKFLQIILIGFGTALANVAGAETLYMQSTPDGSVNFHGPPAAPRYAVSANSNSAAPRRRARVAGSEDSCRGNICDKTRLDDLIDDVAQVYGLESALLHAVVTAESRYNPTAVSPMGAAGLMQLMPGTAKRYGVSNVFDPEQNLRGGAKYLRDLLALFGNDMRLAVAAYHAGETNVARYQNSVPPFRSTMDYVSKVLNYYNKFRTAAGGH